MLQKAIALTASIAVAGLMWITFAALVSPHAAPRHTGFSVDQLRMAEGCVGKQPVYYAPDGRLWTWSDNWVRVDAAARGSCDVLRG